jgi:hypothetical protein
MKNKKLLMVLAGVVILAAGIGVGAYAASTYGTQSDPLVAKSYLDDVLTPQLQDEFESLVDMQVQQLEQQISSVESSITGNFQAVTLSSGQTLKGSVGCEIVLRSGSATASGSTGLSDLTSGTVVSNGSAMTENHLCVVAAANEGVKASGAVTLLVSGVYSIG